MLKQKILSISYILPLPCKSWPQPSTNKATDPLPAECMTTELELGREDTGSPIISSDFVGFVCMREIAASAYPERSALLFECEVRASR